MYENESNNIDKVTVVELLKNVATKELENSASSLEKSRHDINEAPGAMQSASDTTRYQLGRVADSIEQSHATLSRFITFLDTVSVQGNDDPIGMGSLVEVVDEHGKSFHYFIAPTSAVTSVMVGSVRVDVVSAHSPVGKSLVGSSEGAEISITVPAGTRRLTILRVV